MDAREQCIVLSLALCFAIFFSRSYINSIIVYKFNKSAIKKMDSGRSFREWLLMSRYKSHIPLFFRLLYPISVGVYAGSLILCAMLGILNVSNKIGDLITKFDLAIGVVTVAAIEIIFGTRKAGVYDWGRWIKRRGNPKRKR